MVERVRIHGAGQIVGAIPALLGFHPDDCLVAVFTDPGTGRVRCLARQDLNTPAGQVARVLIGTATRLPDCQLILAAYAPTTGAWPAVEDRILSAVRDVQAAEVTVLELLLVTEGRWWSLMCTNPDCCPPDTVE